MIKKASDFKEFTLIFIAIIKCGCARKTRKARIAEGALTQK